MSDSEARCAYVYPAATHGTFVICLQPRASHPMGMFDDHVFVPPKPKEAEP